MGELVDAVIAWRDVFIEKDWVKKSLFEPGWAEADTATGACLQGGLEIAHPRSLSLAVQLRSVACGVSQQLCGNSSYITFNDLSHTTRADIDDFFDRLIRKCKEVEAE